MNEGNLALVTGAGGFIGHHLVKRLVSQGWRVRGADLKRPEYERSHAEEFVVATCGVPMTAWRCARMWSASST